MGRVVTLVSSSAGRRVGMGYDAEKLGAHLSVERETHDRRDKD